MNLVKQIGRHEFPLLSIVAIIKQDDGNYEFHLPYGVRLILTADEKRQYDEALVFHAHVLQVYGMCKSAGLRG